MSLLINSIWKVEKFLIWVKSFRNQFTWSYDSYLTNKNSFSIKQNSDKFFSYIFFSHYLSALFDINIYVKWENLSRTYINYTSKVFFYYIVCLPVKVQTIYNPPILQYYYKFLEVIWVTKLISNGSKQTNKGKSPRLRICIEYVVNKFVFF